MYLNKKHASSRVALGKSAIVVDQSMMNVKERELDQGLRGTEVVGGRAFDDETDLKNEDFIFVY